jgi:hypothetical protein
MEKSHSKLHRNPEPVSQFCFIKAWANKKEKRNQMGEKECALRCTEGGRRDRRWAWLWQPFSLRLLCFVADRGGKALWRQSMCQGREFLKPRTAVELVRSTIWCVQCHHVPNPHHRILLALGLSRLSSLRPRPLWQTVQSWDHIWISGRSHGWPDENEDDWMSLFGGYQPFPFQSTWRLPTTCLPPWDLED